MENNRHPVPVTISPDDNVKLVQYHSQDIDINIIHKSCLDFSGFTCCTHCSFSLSLFVYLVQYSFMSSCIYHKNQDNKRSITSIPNVILLCASLTPDNQSCVDFQNFVTSEVLYKWNCTICNILWLNSFSAQQNSLKVHLNCWASIKSSFCVIAK